MFPSKLMQSETKPSGNPATLLLRACAGALDIGILVIGWFAFHTYYISTPNASMQIIHIVDRIFPLILILYFTLFEWYWKKTPGKWFFGLKLERKKNQTLNFKIVAFRNILKFFSIFIFFAGYLIALLRKDNLAFHDLLSGCIVINCINET